ncbi:MAG: putative DNA modification/repair radical SAM protein, partial [Oscillospiraceae bacterium]
PGASASLLQRMGRLADRMSVNIELPSQQSLLLLAPQKTKEAILRPMGLIRDGITENRTDLVKYRSTPAFAPAGQSTQMIVGATPDTDWQILKLTQGLYRKYSLKRVFFSAYTPVVRDALLPAADTKPPLLREHRLYQADWLLRFYGFDAQELLDEQHPNFNPWLDPKCNWAVNHMERFPIEINTAAESELLRVPGIGVTSAKRIIAARRAGSIDFSGLRRIGVVLKRARYFITCSGRLDEGVRVTPETAFRALMSERCAEMLPQARSEQLSLFDPPQSMTQGEMLLCLTGQR